MEAAMIAGHPPPGVYMGKGLKGALRIACDNMGIPLGGQSTLYARACRVLGRKPDFSLYREPEAPPAVFDRVTVGKPRGRHARESRPDWIVQIGDFMSLDSLNTHIPNENLTGKAKPAYLADIASGREALETMENEIAKAQGYSPRKHITLGNHERRVYAFEESAPEVAGMMQHELEGIFDGFKWGRSPYGQYHFIGGVGFIHCAINRLNKSYGGKNAETTIANDAVFDHVIGHSHVKREHRAPKLGPSQHITVVNLGCALPWGHVEPYMYHGATTGWWWGIRDLTISGGHIVDVSDVSMMEMERRYG
ncbi:MAG: hypothetical protein EBR82_60400 [Caulobacteraceae bacterium]|nr:hypothetical protein [Caulobacteraceae bacterium]